MRKVRLSNNPTLGALPYSLLKEIPWLDYEENPPTENARKLHEGEVEIALIPSDEFAQHGGYLGLDFGISTPQKSDCLLLYLNGNIKNTRKIYLYRESSSSALLLRFLLEERWHTAPQLVRSSEPVVIKNLRPGEGLLMLHAGPVEPKIKGFEVFDLSREWRAHTGLPFTFLIWATRPGVLSVEEHRELNDAMHRAVKARTFLAMERAKDFEVEPEDARRLVEENFDYYIDKTIRDGLNALFRRGYERGILPSMRYQHPMFSLLEGKAGPFHEQTIHEILTDAMQGKRICVADAVRLAEEASLADLGLAADNIRTRIVTDRTVKFVAVIDHRDLNQPEALEEEASIMADQGVRHILLLPKAFHPGDLERWEQIILRLKHKFSVEIEGFGIPMIIQAAKERGITIREVVARLVTAGLDAVPSIGGGMLIDRIHRRRAKQTYTVEEWIETAKWLHAVSAKVSCFLSFDPQDSWEERMVHLHKLRSLQDLTPGFRSFHVEIAPWVKGVFPVEDYLRSLALCRLFLDNIHSVQEPSANASSVSGALGLCFGADELHFRASEDNSDPRADSVRFLRTLWEAGIDLDQAVVKPDGDEEIIQ